MSDPKVALVIISDRGDKYLPRALKSIEEHIYYPFHERIIVDDEDHQLGMAGAVRTAWAAVSPGVHYIFHWEEDFLASQRIDLEPMLATLYWKPHLSQLVLKRQAWSTEEKHAGGIVEMYPDSYEEKWLANLVWTEHRRIFSLNPCLIPARVFRRGWPDGNEAEQTAILNHDSGNRFAFWGEKYAPPVVEHIGEDRGTGWRL